MANKTNLKEGIICLENEFMVTGSTTLKELEDYCGLSKVEWKVSKETTDEGNTFVFKFRSLEKDKYVEAHSSGLNHTDLHISCNVEDIPYSIGFVFNEQEKLQEVSFFPYTPEIEKVYKEIRPLREAGEDCSELRKKAHAMQYEISKKMFFDSIENTKITEEEYDELGLKDHRLVVQFNNIKIALPDDDEHFHKKGLLFIYYL